MGERFTGAKSSQMKKDAYGILAAELSTAMQRENDHTQLNQLRKMWFHPNYRATGNGRNVRSKPQYFDIMFEYWSSKPGYSQETLLSSDEPNTLVSAAKASEEIIDENDYSSDSSALSSDTDDKTLDVNNNVATDNTEARNTESRRFRYFRVDSLQKKSKLQPNMAYQMPNPYCVVSKPWELACNHLVAP
ncbi:hypothetical protein AeRB84_004107 [Aphanomyces euteiches]|nr:hypothetical protein AeRB84_004107 [Aphanomyces euteiches]